MPHLSSAGMATSARHVVGLHEPPRKTSGNSGVSSSSSDEPAADARCTSGSGAVVVLRPIRMLFNEVLPGLAAAADVVVGRSSDVLAPFVRNRLRSDARTQNSPNVSPLMRLLFPLAFGSRLLPRRANSFAVCSISLTEIQTKRKYQVTYKANQYSKTIVNKYTMKQNLANSKAPETR